MLLNLNTYKRRGYFFLFHLFIEIWYEWLYTDECECWKMVQEEQVDEEEEEVVEEVEGNGWSGVE